MFFHHIKVLSMTSKQFIIDNPLAPAIADAYQQNLSSIQQPNEFTVSGPEDTTKPF